jgi:hypothetical protein
VSVLLLRHALATGRCGTTSSAAGPKTVVLPDPDAPDASPPQQDVLSLFFVLYHIGQDQERASQNRIAPGGPA